MRSEKRLHSQERSKFVFDFRLFIGYNKKRGEDLHMRKVERFLRIQEVLGALGTVGINLTRSLGGNFGKGNRLLFNDEMGDTCSLRVISAHKQIARYKASSYSYDIWAVSFGRVRPGIKYQILALYWKEDLMYILKIPIGRLSPYVTVIPSHRLDESEFAKFVVYRYKDELEEVPA